MIVCKQVDTKDTCFIANKLYEPYPTKEYQKKILY